MLISEFYNSCREKHIKFVVAGIEGTDQTKKTLDFFNKKGAFTLNIATGLGDKKYWNKNDNYIHPSAIANEIYATRLNSFLKKNVLNKNQEPPQ
jgi:hypothetical protein